MRVSSSFMIRGFLLAQSLTGTVAAAQSAADFIRAGVEAQLARDPVTGRHEMELAIAADSTSYEAHWRLAELLVDIGKQTPDSVKSAARDSLYAAAEAQGRIAVALNPDGADGHYILAAGIGRASLTKGKRERVKRASEIRAEALRAIELDPSHHKAYHVMGRWNAEIMRLSGLQRFFAKSFLGGKIFDAAAWDSAVVYMGKALQYSPDNIYHHLDMAEILIDRERFTEARGHLSRIAELPIFDVMDPVYKERAALLLVRTEGKKDKGE